LGDSFRTIAAQENPKLYTTGLPVASRHRLGTRIRPPVA